MSRRGSKADREKRYEAQRRQRWEAFKLSNPGEAADLEDLWSDRDRTLEHMRAKGAPVDDRVAVLDWARAEEDAIRRRYTDTESYNDAE